MILIANNTGRKFICVGLKQVNCTAWNTQFTIGNEYYEVINNFKDIYIKDRGILLLVSNCRYCMFVDESQFKEIDLENKQFRKIISGTTFFLN